MLAPLAAGTKVRYRSMGTDVNVRKILDWRKLLIYTHRWSGIVLTMVFVVWFVSGMIFVYVGMPTLPAEERLRRMEPLDLAGLRVAPSEAASLAGIESPSRVRMRRSRAIGLGTLGVDERPRRVTETIVSGHER